MQKKYKGSIQKELLRSIFVIVLTVTLIGYGIFVKTFMKNEQLKDIALTETISTIIGQDVAKIVYTDDISVASDVTTQLASFKNLLELVLYKNDHEILFQYSKDNMTHKTTQCTKEMFMHPLIENNKLKFCTKILYEGEPLVDAKYTFKIKTSWDIFIENLPFLIFLLFVIFIVAYLLSLYYAKRYTHPILTLVRFLENIHNEKYLHKRLKIEESNEFGILYEEINTMLSRMEESYHELKIASVAFEIPTPMLITDRQKRVLRINKAFKRLTGFKEKEIIGSTPHFLVEESTKEIMLQTKESKLLYINLNTQPVKGDNETIYYYVITLIDITEQKKMQKELEQLTYYDSLTGLINRVLLEKRLTELFSQNHTKYFYGFLCFDIENFRLINDAYSFEFGNKLLQKIANTIKENYQNDKRVVCIAKIGVDEFFLGFKFQDVKREDVALKMEMEAQKILQIFDQPLSIDNKPISISLHIGITTVDTKKVLNARSVIKESVSAINIAKENGLKIAFYNQEYQKKSLKHISLYSQLTNAIKQKEFVLFYQLQNNDKREIIGAEALIRWIKPDGKVVSPGEFIPLLEQSGLILHLSEWIVESVCKQLSQWQENERTKHFTISINACVKEFHSEVFLENIKKNLQKYNIPKGLLKVELLESMLAEDIELVSKKMYALKEIGVKIALDDFGTGYSSLSYLKQLPIDQLKIDQIFIKDITTNRKNQAIVKSIIALQEAFDVDIIAEGVETKEDMLMLQKLGCSHYQGYYFSKPQPIDKITIDKGGVLA